MTTIINKNTSLKEINKHLSSLEIVFAFWAVDKNILNLMPINTKKLKSVHRDCSKDSVVKGIMWYKEDQYLNLHPWWKILNLTGRKNGEAYKENVTKTISNTVAKTFQETHKEENNVVFNPFQDVTFASTRKARDTKRKQLQLNP